MQNKKPETPEVWAEWTHSHTYMCMHAYTFVHTHSAWANICPWVQFWGSVGWSHSWLSPQLQTALQHKTHTHTLPNNKFTVPSTHIFLSSVRLLNTLTGQRIQGSRGVCLYIWEGCVCSCQCSFQKKNQSLFSIYFSRYVFSQRNINPQNDISRFLWRRLPRFDVWSCPDHSDLLTDWWWCWNVGPVKGLFL